MNYYLNAYTVRPQNNNESINNIIWNRCLKAVYVGKTTLSMGGGGGGRGVASAVISFNDGNCGILDVIKKMTGSK